MKTIICAAGLSEGQAMQWTTREGTRHVLSVLSVSKEPTA